MKNASEKWKEIFVLKLLPYFNYKWVKQTFIVSKILNEKIKIIAAVRTDKNVNSWGQSAHFDTE